jgi:hypothetical protein
MSNKKIVVGLACIYVAIWSVHGYVNAPEAEFLQQGKFVVALGSVAYGIGSLLPFVLVAILIWVSLKIFGRDKSTNSPVVVSPVKAVALRACVALSAIWLLGTIALAIWASVGWHQFLTLPYLVFVFGPPAGLFIGWHLFAWIFSPLLRAKRKVAE